MPGSQHVIPVDRRSPLPLWAQVQNDIERRLRLGEFETSFPGEVALLGQYGVSRHTVREALRRLRAAGVIESSRGRAPKVAQNEIVQSQSTLYSLFASVEAAGHRQRSIVVALDARADSAVAARLGLDASTLLVYLERLRLCDDEPLAMDRVWLPSRIAAPLLDADFSQTSLYGELRDRCDIQLTGGRERVRAVVPTPDQRRLLQMPDDIAALAIERTGDLRGVPVEWRQTVVRGDRFSFVTDLSRPGHRSVTVFDPMSALPAPWLPTPTDRR